MSPFVFVSGYVLFGKKILNSYLLMLFKGCDVYILKIKKSNKNHFDIILSKKHF
jgi:hypothetical protein